MATVSTRMPLRTAAVSQQPAAPPDPQLVAEAKQEISSLVQEIAVLASQDISVGEFCSGFLERVVAAMAAVGGVMWTKDETGRLLPEHRSRGLSATLDPSVLTGRPHLTLVQNVLQQNHAQLAAPIAEPSSHREASNPTPWLLVIAPVIVDGQTVGVAEILQRPAAGLSTQRGYLRFLVQMCEVAAGYFRAQRLRQQDANPAVWREAAALVESLHRSLDVRETAYTIANEARRTIGCDRVSLAICYGNRCRVEAVSGLDSIDRRAAEVQRLGQLATAVLRTREPLWSGSYDQELPPQIQQPLQAYLDHSHVRLIGVLPLMPRGKLEKVGSERDRVPDSLNPIAALMIERYQEATLTSDIRTRSELVAHHATAALQNAIEHSSVLLLPFWKFLGKAGWLVRGQALPKTLLVLAAMIAAVYILASVPTDFEVSARGKLQPAQSRQIFAPLDGVVSRVPVDHGQIVEAGAILAELTSTELDLQVAELLGRQTTNHEQLTARSRALLDNKGGAARLSPTEENRLTGEMLQLRQEAEAIERELSLLREKQRQLTITAPQRGQVVTWKLRDLLLMRPVSRGQTLLTLADTDGPWELELYLPERRLGHVQRSHAAAGGEVTFVLSSHPGETFRGRVVEIEQAAEVRGEEGNTVLVRVAVERNELPPLHDQTTVTAKLNCGRTSIGYAWFCDLIETIQSKVLFWFA